MDCRITAKRNAVSLKQELREEIVYRKFVEKKLAKEKYRADSLNMELDNTLHSCKNFEKIMVARKSKLIEETEKRVKAETIAEKLTQKLAKEESLKSNLKNNIMLLDWVGVQTRLNFSLQLKLRKKIAENKLMNLKQEIEKVTKI